MAKELAVSNQKVRLTTSHYPVLYNIYVEERNIIVWTWQNPIYSGNGHQAINVLSVLLSLRSTYAACTAGNACVYSP